MVYIHYHYHYAPQHVTRICSYWITIDTTILNCVIFLRTSEHGKWHYFQGHVERVNAQFKKYCGPIVYSSDIVHS